MLENPARLLGKQSTITHMTVRGNIVNNADVWLLLLLQMHSH
jgi:hypothetical protein